MMSPILEEVGKVLLRYRQLFTARYHEKWMPTDAHIEETLKLFKSPLPGFEAYTATELIARLDSFFRKSDEWITSTKHNYLVFTKHIHRWLTPPVTSTPARTDNRPDQSRCDCGNELLPGEICLKCYPQCDSCGCQHAPEDSCDAFAERTQRLRQMFANSSRRQGTDVVRLDGDVAIDAKQVRNIRNSEGARS